MFPGRRVVLAGRPARYHPGSMRMSIGRQQAGSSLPAPRRGRPVAAGRSGPLASMLRWGLLAVAIFAACTILLLALAVAQRGGSVRTMAAPGFTLADQAGRRHTLAAYRGRPVFLLFLPTPPTGAPPGAEPAARAALESLRRAGSKLDHLGVKLFALTDLPPAAAARLHTEAGLDFPLLYDERSAVLRRYLPYRGRPVTGPITFIVGPEGRVEAAVEPDGRRDYAEKVLIHARCCLGEMTPSGKVERFAVVPDFGLPGALTEEAASVATLYGEQRRPVTVLLFLSTRCPCSRAYTDRLRALAEEFSPRQVRFVALFSNADEDVEVIADFVRRARWPFLVARDAGADVAGRVGAMVTPEALVLDRHGRIRYHGRVDDTRLESEVRRRDLREAILAVLAGREPEPWEQVSFGCAILGGRAAQ